MTAEMAPLPKSASEFHDALNKIQVLKNIGENFVRVNDKENKIIMFSTKRNLRFLCTITTDIYVDGTIYSSPKYFKLPFAVHGQKNNTYVPPSFYYYYFFLLCDKNIESYKKVFLTLRHEYESLSLFVNYEFGSPDFNYGPLHFQKFFYFKHL